MPVKAGDQFADLPHMMAAVGAAHKSAVGKQGAANLGQGMAGLVQIK